MTLFRDTWNRADPSLYWIESLVLKCSSGLIPNRFKINIKPTPNNYYTVRFSPFNILFCSVWFGFKYIKGCKMLIGDSIWTKNKSLRTKMAKSYKNTHTHTSFFCVPSQILKPQQKHFFLFFISGIRTKPHLQKKHQVFEFCYTAKPLMGFHYNRRFFSYLM